MNILYIGRNGKYGENIAEVINMIGNPTDDQIAAASAPAVAIDVNIINGLVEVPFGSPNAVVIDGTGEELIVRPKGDAELLFDAKEQAVMELSQSTESRILKVCDDERQRSLSILYTSMSADDKARVDVYTAWHKSMLALHYTLKAGIEAATSVADVDAVIADLNASFGDLEAAAPLDDVELSSYVI